jgi:uncharacterized protein YndB with AHSA1/START domain
MRGVTTITRTLRAAPEAVWARIAAVDRLHEWLPIVTRCRIEGSGPGARRVCDTAHGTIVERVERIDHGSRTLVYTVTEQPILPLDDYRGTLHVTPHAGGRAGATWTVEYQVAEEVREPVDRALRDVIAVGLDGLERLVRDRSARCRRPNRAVLLGILLLSMGGVSCLAPPAAAQDRMIPWSQRASVSQHVASTEISLAYSRPVARGRTLFGGVVPWRRPWNPGADSATTIAVSRDVEVEGQTLRAGRYTLWAIPEPASWTVIFSRAVDILHTPYPGEGFDALRLTVKPERGEHMETLAFYFPVVQQDSALLRLHWGETIVPLRIRAPH